MKKIYNIIAPQNENIGESVGSPLDYFSFPLPTEKIDVRYFREREEDLRSGFIILGGGGLIHLPSPEYNNGIIGYLEEICDLSPWMVSWGVGHNIHDSTEISYPDYFVKKFKLHGIRDMRQSLRWVPCVSCMDKLFHHRHKKIRGLAITTHVDFSLSNEEDLPIMYHSTEQVTKEDLIRFIAGTDTIITNSYHGAYWGALLNRKVVVVDPFSTRFYGLPESVKLSSQQSWKAGAKTAKVNKGFLKQCRDANTKYHKDVLKLIEEYVRA